MAYAAVTSLMETLSLNFLQSQPRLPLEDLEAQIRYGNENLGLLQQILDDMAMKDLDDLEVDGVKASLKDCIKACLPWLIEIFNEVVVKQTDPKNIIAESSSQNSIVLSSRLREVGEVKQKMLSLHQNLRFLQESLEKSEICYDNNAGAMKDLEAKIRDALFKAEERIEMELTSIYLAKDSSLLHTTACLLRLHEIFNEAEKQTDYHRNEFIRTISEYQLASSQNERITDDVSSLFGRIQRRGLLLVSKFSRNTSKFDDSRMVGCHEVFNTILDKLKQQSTKGRQVVSIVGMGGIGKTTLAHRVYEDPSVTSHFDKRAWVTVSQDYNLEQTFRCLIGCVNAASRDEQKIDRNQLAECLQKHLKGQRYLIVIDDIWSTTAWDSVQRCFPDDNNGSRILLTSRLREVAEYASSGNSTINMPFLDADESWNLYCKVFGKTEFLLVFEQIGRDIVKKCKGLPLAITVVASLLSKTDEDEEKWKNVAKSVIGDSNDACSRILYLSYNQLPHHLKACFLYFGVFPEDYEIPVKKLVRFWAAEGFLRDDLNLEEVAMECLKDLVDRSLVIVSKQGYKGEMKTLRIHDMLRDLCLREAGRENFLNVIADEELSFNKEISQNRFSKPCRWITDRWISDTSECLFNQIRSGDKRFHKSHSLHSRFDNTHGFYFAVIDELLISHLKLLRVVDIECGYCCNPCEVNAFAVLVHLRYFALTFQSRYDHPHLCVKLSEHRNMQSFIVRGRFVIWDSSEAFTVWTMPQLRNFCVEQICSLETSSVVHRNLENICWLDPKLCTQDLFTRIPNLKRLGIEGGYAESSDCFYNFVHLGKLEELSIREWHNLNRIPCDGIPWATSFLPNLKKLKFFRTKLPWSVMRLIGMLPNLEVLKLIYACHGRKWESYDGGFCRLTRLVIEGTLLEYWNAEGDHFPVLEYLELHKCKYLREIPSGFVDITTLSLIHLNRCSDSLLTSAKWIQDEQLNNYGNSILVRSENISL